MSAPVTITRNDHSAAELRRAAQAKAGVPAARRMLALAHVLDGRSRSEAAAAAGMDRQTLRDWVHRYNAEGLDGLHDRVHPGPRDRLSGRTSAAMLSVAQEWSAIVGRLPADWFTAEMWPVLMQLCRHVCLSRVIAIESERLRGRCLEDDEILARFEKLTKMHLAESKAIWRAMKI